MTAAVPVATKAPAPVVAAGDRAAHCYLKFFTAQISNQHTRRARMGVSAVRAGAPPVEVRARCFETRSFRTLLSMRGSGEVFVPQLAVRSSTPAST
jgi:hypothetical protein